MTKRKAALFLASAALLAAAGATFLARSPAVSHPVEPSPLGVAISSADLDAVVDVPGPIVVETVVGATWHVPLSGLVNLDAPKARAAGLQDRSEPIVIAFHAVRHPTRGLFLVDTGVERAFRDDRSHALVGGLVGRVIHADDITVRTDTRTWLDAQPERPAGVFLTHLHVDHVTGMRDVPAGTPVYVGAGEGSEVSLENAFVRPITDASLEGKPPLRAWQFQPDPSGAFEGVVDVFGDRTFFALRVPGHTAGSTAYLARTPNGPVLFLGDACHTTWGWENGVEPGSFSADRPHSADSLARLERFVARHPSIDVRPGHQMFATTPVARGN